MFATTGNDVDGYVVSEYLGVVRGIVVRSPNIAQGFIGGINQIFGGNILHNLVGTLAIGHTRYSTTGSSNLRNAQPLTVDCAKGQIAIAHNGNLTNANQLREELEARGSIFQTTVDSEIILHLMAQPTLDGHENNLIQTVHRIEGAYSLVIMTEMARGKAGPMSEGIA